MTLSLNILQQPRDSGQLVPFLARLAGGRRDMPVLVQDEHKLAVTLRSLGYGVIFRAYRPDDARLHETMTPQAFVDAHRHMAVEGIVVQCLNEPVVSSEADCVKLSAWLVETMRLASAAGMRLCVGNFAMGNPHERYIEGGAFDDVLRGLGNHILGLHEYAMRGEVQLSWLIGRYRRWLTRARSIGVARPQIVITECGWDIGGGHQDGWKAHIGAPRYADLLRVMASIYAQDGVTACVFSWGDGFSWGAFNIEGEVEIMSAMVEANSIQTPAPQPPQVEWKSATLTLIGGATAVNLRAQPSAASARLDTITVSSTRVDYGGTADGWHYVRHNGKAGYVSAQFASVTPIVALPPPQPGLFVALPETAFGTREEALRHAAALEGYARAIRAQVGQTS